MEDDSAAHHQQRHHQLHDDDNVDENDGRDRRPAVPPFQARVVPPHAPNVDALSLSDPEGSRSYFVALASDADRRSALSLLSGASGYFSRGSPEPEQCASYLRSCAQHAESLVHGERRVVDDVVQAIGHAATKCRHRHEASVVIPLLTRLSVGERVSDPVSASIARALGPSSSSSSSNTTTPLPTLSSVDHGRVLTSARTELLQVCVVAGHHGYACAFADAHPVRTARPETSREDTLRYFYALGVARTNMGRYREATHALETCLALPGGGRTVSAVTVAAYKKILLLDCLEREEEEEECDQPRRFDDDDNNDDDRDRRDNDDRDPEATMTAVTESPFASKPNNATPRAGSGRRSAYSVPRSASNAVVRFFDDNADRAAAADDVEDPFRLRDYRRLVAAAADDALFVERRAAAGALWERDGNVGLVDLVQRALSARRALRRLARAYDVLPLDALARRLSLADAEEAGDAVRRAMATDGSFSFHAVLDDEEGTVEFGPERRGGGGGAEEEDDDGNDLIGELTARVAACVRLAEEIRDRDVALGTSQAVVLASGGGGSAPRGVVDL